jgi:hypothetical protein
MKRKAIYSFIFACSAILLTACGSNDKANPGDGVHGKAGLSIVYESTTSDPGTGKMIGHYHVHAVDESGEPMSGLHLKLSLINGVKEIRGEKLQYGTGVIKSSRPITFDDYEINFSQTGVSTGDSLIILPSSGKADNSYLGNWEITGVSEYLTLKENSYHLEETGGLTYIIGKEERLLGGRVATVAHIAKTDTVETNTTITDANGFTSFNVVFDPVLAGHTATVGVSTLGNRMAMSKIISLRGGSFVGSEIKVPLNGGIKIVSMRLMIDPGNGGTENLIDLNIAPSSFIFDPADKCSLNRQQSNLHTDVGGHVRLAINISKSKSKDKNSTSSGTECTVKWNGSPGSIYMEY